MSTFLLSYVHRGVMSAATIDAADFDDAEARLASLLQGATILGVEAENMPEDVTRWMSRTSLAIVGSSGAARYRGDEYPDTSGRLAHVDLTLPPWAFWLLVVVISAALLILFFYPSHAG